MDQIYKTDLNELFSYQRKGEKLEEKEKVIEIEITGRSLIEIYFFFLKRVINIFVDCGLTN